VTISLATLSQLLQLQIVRRSCRN